MQVASHYYSYSFEPNPNWSSKYPLQPEILAYLKDVARKYEIEKHIRFHSTVTSAHWEKSSATWLVTIKDLKASQTIQRRCKVLVSAVGVLSVPKECNIPGASDFKGRLFHTAHWDHSFNWKDKEVVVIGWCNSSPLHASFHSCAHPYTDVLTHSPLTTRRQWLQRLTSCPSHKWRRPGRKESHPVCSSSPVDTRKAQPAVFRPFQVGYEVGSTRHAPIPPHAELLRGVGFLQL